MSIVVQLISGVFSVLVVAVPLIFKVHEDNKKGNQLLKESMKCSLRNDILDIYEKCKIDKKITMYQLQAITYSYEQYKALGGNSFVDEIFSIVKSFEVVA